MKRIIDELHRLADANFARAERLEAEGSEDTRDEQVALETIAEEANARAEGLEGVSANHIAAAKLRAQADDYSHHAGMTPQDDKGTQRAYLDAAALYTRLATQADRRARAGR